MTGRIKRAVKRRARQPKGGQVVVQPMSPQDTAPDEAFGPDPVFVDDERPARATPDDLDDVGASAVEAGIEGIRQDRDSPDKSS